MSTVNEQMQAAELARQTEYAEALARVRQAIAEAAAGEGRLGVAAPDRVLYDWLMREVRREGAQALLQLMRLASLNLRLGG